MTGQATDRYRSIVGRSPAMMRVLRMVDRVTDSDVPVLVQGETGTGKELIARSLHENGPRAANSFITVNCSALTETLMESELFGHSRGAFTGATEEKRGYFEQAHGGTLFLDEVQDMSCAMQRDLLPVLQEGEILRVGGKRVIKVDVRIVAATNQNLAEMVRDSEFRQDLYYRLNVVTIDLPPLRRRREDIPALIDHFLVDIARRYGLEAPRLERAALDRLVQHGWQGNIRELQNLLEKTLLMLDANSISVRDLEFEASGELGSSRLDGSFDRPYREAKDLFCREYLKASLARHAGNVTKAAQAAGLGRSSFHKMLRKYGLNAREFHPS